MNEMDGHKAHDGSAADRDMWADAASVLADGGEGMVQREGCEALNGDIGARPKWSKGMVCDVKRNIGNVKFRRKCDSDMFTILVGKLLQKCARSHRRRPDQMKLFQESNS